MLHAENIIQIYFPGGGIYLDFHKRLEIYGLEKLARLNNARLNNARLNNVRLKNVKLKNVKLKNVTLKKKRMSLIYLVRTMKRI